MTQTIQIHGDKENKMYIARRSNNPFRMTISFLIVLLVLSPLVLAQNGTQQWAFQTGDMVTSSPAIGTDGTIYVGSWDNYLYALDPDGTEKWKN